MRPVFNFLFSIKTTLLLLAILGIGAAAATFIENDYGTSTARVLVYYSWWYIGALFLAGINLAGVIWRYRMWRHPPRFLFHSAFLLIGIGAATTHYFGQEGILHIREGKSENRMLTAEPYLQVTIHTPRGSWYQEFQKDFSAIGDNSFREIILFDGGKELTVQFVDYKFAKKGRATMGLLSVKVCYEGDCKVTRLVGRRGGKGFPKTLDFGDVKVTVEFGSKVVHLPFALKLRDFQLERYPGSMAPSSYASEVTVIDPKSGNFDYRIYMNHTLDHRGYKFFQSSYDQDERGTILSVNDDPGKWPTYLGYILLALGLLWNLFDPTSRFGKLVRYLRATAPFLALLVILGTGFLPVEAATPSDFERYLPGYRQGSAATAGNFGRLIVQSPMGRMEPVNSLDTQLLYKLHGSLSWKGMDQDQVLMGMLSRPELWRYARLLKVKSPKLRKVLGLPDGEKYAAFADAFEGKKGYKLKKYVEEANRIKPGERGTFEREVIALDEKLNVIYMVFYGNLYRIFPMPGDPHNTWYNPLEAMQKFAGKERATVEALTRHFIDAAAAGDWQAADRMVGQIRHYQQRYGASLIPPKEKIDAELLYNRLHLFPRLVGLYLLLGLVLILAGFAEILRENPGPWFRRIRLGAGAVLILLFALHTFGLGLRWYIAGHAPWSDAYESLLYISWSAMLAGLIFFRHSLLVLGATVMVAGIFLFTAHLSNINPQITNLVPVLKSYWLTLHVSVITASYGFLGLGALVGYIVLWLFILRNPAKRPQIDRAIRRLVAVDEAALILGLSMLTVGNFIGGVWANESWGRYWGWDPKETWAYVSIIVYTIVVHLRLIRRWDRPFILATASFLAFASVIMTYFGVNFYLSGMHSYASGEPVPIPGWVYAVTVAAIVTILLAWPKRDLGPVLRGGSSIKSPERFGKEV
ncbi:cytochrome c biogenesis protein CcsA [Nitratifractor salsuginis]|uniref:Cytochrome c assembly protein n=1 Tax=Nitratifractor salsuginis (strain DSM 16511 / JCM 12458 / E9I37-1) TaxID=749222 RepID=E6WZ92_NITSE|nr:cytochrome c biogenesis protein CcsA [Nitratifractor salsuginis]ADV46604.1 cytochrome c assembly protein [Nitratifractor salsuginis DSM 16511]